MTFRRQAAELFGAEECRVLLCIQHTSPGSILRLSDRPATIAFGESAKYENHMGRLIPYMYVINV